MQKRFATPVPRVANLAELNTILSRLVARPSAIATCSRSSARSRSRTALPRISPRRRRCPGIGSTLACSSPRSRLTSIRPLAFDGNRYSVPRTFAFQTVSVKGYVDRVVIVAQGQVVATHGRSFEKKTMILDPIHYLAALGRKPGCAGSRAGFPRLEVARVLPRLPCPTGTVPRRHGRLAAIRADLAAPGRASDAARKPSHRSMPARSSLYRRGRNPADAVARRNRSRQPRCALRLARKTPSRESMSRFRTSDASINF